MPRLLADLYAAAALQADDAYGEEHDLVSQHYGISKADLSAVIALVQYWLTFLPLGGWTRTATSGFNRRA